MKRLITAVVIGFSGAYAGSQDWDPLTETTAVSGASDDTSGEVLEFLAAFGTPATLVGLLALAWSVYRTALRVTEILRKEHQNSIAVLRSEIREDAKVNRAEYDAMRQESVAFMHRIDGKIGKLGERIDDRMGELRSDTANVRDRISHLEGRSNEDTK